MAINLLEQAKSLFTPEVVQKAAGQFGESESIVTKALSGIVPGLLGGLAGKAESPGGTSSVFNLVQQAANLGGHESITGMLNNEGMLEKGWDMVKGLFGSQSDNFLSKLTTFSGSKVSGITSLLGLAAPMLFGWLGKHVSSTGMTASSLGSLLSDQKSSIMSAIPGGLGLSGIFSNAFGSPATAAPRAAPTYTEPPAESSGRPKWLWPLILLLALAALLWWWRGRNKTAEVATTTVDTVVATPDVAPAPVVVPGKLDTVSGNFIYDVGTLGNVTLPNGTVINVGDNSSEAKLFKFLNDASMTVDTVDKTKGWISLDRVYFETGKSTLTKESSTQLKNIAEILKAFPNAGIKFGGYTDNTGDNAANMKLSDARAMAAMKAVQKNGIDAKRLASEGYGSDHPIADNATADGKAQNRRVDIRVTSK